MSEAPAPAGGLERAFEAGPHEAVAAARELSRLRARADEVRATLRRLEGQLLAAQGRLGSSPSNQLREANERLVLATLQAQTDAEAAGHALNKASRSAERDGLTGLPNRVLLLDRFVSAITGAKRRGTRFAVFFLDLNRFKLINDALGHAVGDEVIKLVAHRLTTAVREADTVSRLGGDEFVILLPDISAAAHAERVAAKVIASLGAPSRVGDHVLRLSASIGISVYPEHGEDADTLMDRADAAMYHAKRQGVGCHVFHGDIHATDGLRKSRALVSLKAPLTRIDVARAEDDVHREQLREANERLVLAVLDEQTLAAAAKQAQVRQTGFLAMIAHELRNPLEPLSSAASLLGSDAPDAPTVDVLRAIIERQLAQLSRLVNDLLDLSRVNSGKLRLELHEVDLVGILDAAMTSCRPAMDTRLQHVTCRMPKCALPVLGDAMRLTQIFVNLLDNASRYTPEGGSIGLEIEVASEQFAISVSDTGIGIPEETLPHVFDLFVQDTRAVVLRGAGLGLGLAVVRELARAHDGDVSATSAGPGLGSRFVVTLPRCKA